MAALHARRLRGWGVAGAAVTGLLLFAYGGAHLVDLLSHPDNIVVLVYVAAVAYLLVQFVATFFDRPHRADSAQAARLADLSVVVLVPCYNEEPAALRACLESFLRQTRLPQGVSVVDDGSTVSAFEAERAWLLEAAAARGVAAHWLRIENHGKRVAQVMAAQAEPDADVYVTVDSDSILDPHAIEEGLKPFARADVQSVAAIVLSTNVAANALTRVMDLICVTLQLADRSALSAMGSVMVNAGACAFYRGDVLRDNLVTYLTETFRGRPMQMSDDSMLTLFALRRGRTVHQSTAFAFTLMPETLGRHARQQLRWMRGSFIRSW